MSNSTTVAATIGVSALGVLAYYGYQNMNGTSEDVDETKLYNELDGNNNNESTNFQEEAKKEVAKVVTNAKMRGVLFGKQNMLHKRKLIM